MKRKNSAIDIFDKMLEEDIKFAAEYGPSSRTRYRLICQLFKQYGLASGRVLDAGASTGDLSLHLKKHFKINNLLAIDCSSVSIKQMKQKSLDVRQCDLTNYNSLKSLGKFSTIVSSEVLEHIEKDEVAISNFHKLLLPRGYLLVTSPYDQSKWSWMDENSGHLRRYNDKALESKIIQAGFQVVKKKIWGAAVYDIYYRVINKLKNVPTALARKPNLIKQLGLKLLYYLFFLDDFFCQRSKGRTIIILARKI